MFGVIVLESQSWNNSRWNTLWNSEEKNKKDDEQGRKIEICDEVANDLDGDDEDVETLEMKKMI